MKERTILLMGLTLVCLEQSAYCSRPLKQQQNTQGPSPKIKTRNVENPERSQKDLSLDAKRIDGNLRAVQDELVNLSDQLQEFSATFGSFMQNVSTKIDTISRKISRAEDDIARLKKLSAPSSCIKSEVSINAASAKVQGRQEASNTQVSLDKHVSLDDQFVSALKKLPPKDLMELKRRIESLKYYNRNYERVLSNLLNGKSNWYNDSEYREIMALVEIANVYYELTGETSLLCAAGFYWYRVATSCARHGTVNRINVDIPSVQQTIMDIGGCLSPSAQKHLKNLFSE